MRFCIYARFVLAHFFKNFTKLKAIESFFSDCERMISRLNTERARALQSPITFFHPEWHPAHFDMICPRSWFIIVYISYHIIAAIINFNYVFDPCNEFVVLLLQAQMWV